MAGYDINVGRDLLPGLLSGQNGLANLVESVLNQILEAQVAEPPRSQPNPLRFLLPLVPAHPG